MFFKPSKESLKLKIVQLQADAELYRQRQTYWALKAYNLDPMMEPLRWGRLQNEANWMGYRRMKILKKIEVLQDKLHELEKKSCLPA